MARPLPTTEQRYSAILEPVWERCQAEADALTLDPSQMSVKEIRRTLAAVQFLAAVLGLVVTHGDRGDGKGAAELARRTIKAMTGRQTPNYSKGK